MSNSPHFPESFFRVSIKGLFVSDGRILLFREAPALSGQWELPGGGLDFGEDPAVALKREIAEEAGLQVTDVSANPKYAWTARFENQRGMAWYHSLVLCYEIGLAHIDFVATEECTEIAFFDHEAFSLPDIHHQSRPLLEKFDPGDFRTAIQK